jgi:hypothetical protein
MCPDDQATKGSAPESVIIGRPQAAQPCMPPATFTARQPASTSACAARAERAPERQITYTVSSRGTSSARAPSWPSGMWQAPGTYPAAHSSSSRTSSSHAPSGTLAAGTSGACSATVDHRFLARRFPCGSSWDSRSSAGTTGSALPGDTALSLRATSRRGPGSGLATGPARQRPLHAARGQQRRRDRRPDDSGQAAGAAGGLGRAHHVRFGGCCADRVVAGRAVIAGYRGPPSLPSAPELLGVLPAPGNVHPEVSLALCP